MLRRVAALLTWSAATTALACGRQRGPDEPDPLLTGYRALAYGRVTDASGAAVAGSTVTARSFPLDCGRPATALVSATADASGAYRVLIPALPADSFCLALTAATPDGLRVASASVVTVRYNAAAPKPIRFDSARVDIVIP